MADRQWGFTPPGFNPPYLNVTEKKDGKEYQVTVRGELAPGAHEQPGAAILISRDQFRDYVRSLAVDLGLGPIY